MADANARNKRDIPNMPLARLMDKRGLQSQILRTPIENLPHKSNLKNNKINEKITYIHNIKLNPIIYNLLNIVINYKRWRLKFII